MTFKKPKRTVNKVYIHCSDSNIASHDNIATITKWHTDPKPPKGEKMRPGYGKGWKWVGYHYFIRQDGTIEEGRTLEEQPAAQGLYKGKYYNKESIAICLSGGRYKKLDSFTLYQFKSLKELCEEINQSYYNITFHGHCEVSKKTCPVFDYKKVLNLDNEGLMPFNSASNVFVEGQELPKIIEIKSTPFNSNLLIKPKKKMVLSLAITGAVSLVKLFAPTIINKFKKVGKNLAEDTAKKLIKKAEKKLGFAITDKESANKARDQLDSKDLFELEKLALKTDAQMFSAELKYGEDLGKSWKDEFVTVITFITFIVIVVMAYKEPERADELVSVIKALLLTPFGALFVFVGLSAIGGKHIMTKLADKFIK